MIRLQSVQHLMHALTNEDKRSVQYLKNKYAISCNLHSICISETKFENDIFCLHRIRNFKIKSDFASL